MYKEERNRLKSELHNYYVYVEDLVEDLSDPELKRLAEDIS